MCRGILSQLSKPASALRLRIRGSSPGARGCKRLKTEREREREREREGESEKIRWRFRIDQVDMGVCREVVAFGCADGLCFMLAVVRAAV